MTTQERWNEIDRIFEAAQFLVVDASFVAAFLLRVGLTQSSRDLGVISQRKLEKSRSWR